MWNERRRQPRLRLAFPVLIDGPYGTRRCIARDLNAQGVFVQTPDPYELGTEVRVSFTLPDGSWEMCVRCVVRHLARRPLVPGDGPMHGIGLSFEEVEDELTDTITIGRRMHA